MSPCELLHVSFPAIFMLFFLRLTKRYEAQIGGDHIQTEDFVPNKLHWILTLCDVIYIDKMAEIDEHLFFSIMNGNN